MARFTCEEVADQGRRRFLAGGAAAATLITTSGASAPAHAEATAKQKEFMAEANRLAVEAVDKGWGGPFGAVIVQDGEIVGRGQNRVLLTGCPVYHAEVTAIIEASARLNPKTLMGSDYCDGLLEMIPRPAGSPDIVASRAKMLAGCEIYVNGAPCPMCMSAIYWSRIDRVYFGASLADATNAGFSDAFQYEDFQKPYEKRSIAVTPGLEYQSSQIAFQTWNKRPNRHYY